MNIKRVPIVSQAGRVLKKFFDAADEQRFYESEKDYEFRKMYWPEDDEGITL